jgi:hypothetical protein
VGVGVDVSRMEFGRQQRALHINEQVMLAALDLLPPPCPRGIAAVRALASEFKEIGPVENPLAQATAPKR